MHLLTLYRGINAALPKGGYQQIIDAAYAAMGLPIQLHDSAFNMLAVAPKQILNDTLWDISLETGSFPREIIMKFHEQGFMEAASTRNSPYYVDWGDCAKSPRIQGVIRVNDVVEGYISIICPRELYSTEYDEAMALIVNACTIEMERSRYSNLSSDPLLKVLMHDLIRNKLSSNETMDLWRERLPVSFCGSFKLFAANVPKANLPASQKHLMYELRERFPLHIEMIDNGILYMLFYSLKEKDSPQLEEAVRGALGGLNASAGYSELFDDLLNFGIRKKQAENALSLGGRLTQNESMHSYEDYRFPIIMNTIMENSAECEYIAPGIRTLTDYDKMYGTDYLYTLERYVLSGCNNKRTLEELDIHRNTLLYRLQKIEEILSISLDNAELVAHYYISFYMLKMKEHF